MKIKRLIKDIPLDKALKEKVFYSDVATDYLRVVDVIIRPVGDFWRIEITGEVDNVYFFEVRESFPPYPQNEEVLSYPHRYTLFNTFEEAQEYVVQGFERLRNAMDRRIIAQREAEVQRKMVESLSKGFTFLYRSPQDTDSEIVEIKLL